ncbi:OsmC family protein [Chryseosolibacter indicus]|uniref:OsmC family protein n=1 Tax=Chryseosolibacter indicus TaxID=2782351 RepID=A0ABS5VW06_9BACT|nr:OsmC family protein [Chryseosolibacter indicus]MBT1705516.1 OsmC family protein [Chryseosolibacter indicus]
MHHYKTKTTWTGNRGQGTLDYISYDRNHEIAIDGKQTLYCSSDPAFRGDKTRQNPEELLVASLSSCHMLWYLHLCAVNGIVVTEYVDEASGVMEENNDGSGQFTEVTLHPVVTVDKEEMTEKANALHHEANKMCFIARSVKFPVHHKPKVLVAKSTAV